jgi:hypothetical protein
VTTPRTEPSSAGTTELATRPAWTPRPG